MGFALVALHGTALAAARVLAAPLWGRLIDRLGARPVLIACAFGVSACRSIWLFPTPTFLWPLALDAVLAGALWGGHNLAMFVLAADGDAPAGAAALHRRPRDRGWPRLQPRHGLRRRAGRAPAADDGVRGTRPHSLQLLFALSAVLRFGAAFAPCESTSRPPRAWAPC